MHVSAGYVASIHPYLSHGKCHDVMWCKTLHTSNIAVVCVCFSSFDDLWNVNDVQRIAKTETYVKEMYIVQITLIEIVCTEWCVCVCISRRIQRFYKHSQMSFLQLLYMVWKKKSQG